MAWMNRSKCFAWCGRTHLMDALCVNAMMDHPEGLTSESSGRALICNLVSLINKVSVDVLLGSFMICMR